MHIVTNVYAKKSLKDFNIEYSQNRLDEINILYRGVNAYVVYIQNPARIGTQSVEMITNSFCSLQYKLMLITQLAIPY